MNYRLAAILVAGAIAVAGCGGGGSSAPSQGVTPSGPATTTPTPGATATPVATPVPTATPTAPATQPPVTGNPPLSETVGAAPAWVDPNSHFTLYYLTSDTATGTGCPAPSCTGTWPVFVPAAGSQAIQNVTIINRADGGQQWAYQGHPLYTFAGDNARDQANGEGIPLGNGTWHVARPSAAPASTPPPGGGVPPPPPPCHYYC